MVQRLELTAGYEKTTESCLDELILFGEGSLRRAVREFGGRQRRRIVSVHDQFPVPAQELPSRSSCGSFGCWFDAVFLQDIQQIGLAVMQDTN